MNVRLAFSVVENPGVYALLLGSGVSRAAAIPTGWDITLDLVRRVAAAEGVKNQADWAAWHRTRFESDPGYSSLLDALSITPAERRSILHNYIEPTAEHLAAGERTPTKAHKAIADLVQAGLIRVVITTNFDRLLETALSAVGVEPVVIKSVDDLAGASPLPHSRCYLLKLHGDYLDNRILNTDDELAAYPADYDRLLDRILDEYGLIVSGWSGDWDPALRAAISRAPNRRYPTWWASRGEPSTAGGDIIRERGATVVTVPDADTFFSKLKDSVEVLSKARTPSPDTLELLLATTKRNLANAERRIDLADSFAEQVDRIIRRLGSDEFPIFVPRVSGEELIERWRAIEGIAEPLARMGGLAGRWGTGGEFSLMQDAIRNLLSVRPVGGNGLLNALTTYPAYLLFLTYSLGLTKAARWTELVRWLNEDIHPVHQSPKPAHSSLFMQRFQGIDPDQWKHWPGLSGRKTPWADHLVEAVVPWTRDYGLSGEAALDNFHMLELIGGVASLSAHDENVLLQREEPIWMPYGQTMWHEDARTRILARLETEDVKPKILAAGLCRGSTNHWGGSLNVIGLLANHVEWR